MSALSGPVQAGSAEWRGTKVILSGCLRNNQSLSAPGAVTGASAPISRGSGLPGAVGVQAAGYCPRRHGGRCDDKDLLREALTSSPGYARGLSLGTGPWELGLVTPGLCPPSGE